MKSYKNSNITIIIHNAGSIAQWISWRIEMTSKTAKRFIAHMKEHRSWFWRPYTPTFFDLFSGKPWPPDGNPIPIHCCIQPAGLFVLNLWVCVCLPKQINIYIYMYTYTHILWWTGASISAPVQSIYWSIDVWTFLSSSDPHQLTFYLTYMLTLPTWNKGKKQ